MIGGETRTKKMLCKIMFRILRQLLRLHFKLDDDANNGSIQLNVLQAIFQNYQGSKLFFA